MKQHLASLTLLALVFTPVAFGKLGAEGPKGTIGGESGKFLRMGSRAIPGHYIVVLDEDAGGRLAFGDHAGVLNRAQELARATNALPELVYSAALRGFSARMSEAEAIALSRDSRVAFVEEDSRVEALVTQK